MFFPLILLLLLSLPLWPIDLQSWPDVWKLWSDGSEQLLHNRLSILFCKGYKELPQYDNCDFSEGMSMQSMVQSNNEASLWEGNAAGVWGEGVEAVSNLLNRVLLDFIWFCEFITPVFLVYMRISIELPIYIRVYILCIDVLMCV